jgi:hypothetical protein
MASAKEILSEKLLSWLNEYLTEKYSSKYSVEVFIPKSYISKLPNDNIKKIPNYTSFDFKPDILGILKSKEEPNTVKLIFVNRSPSSLSLKEIGEIICYSRIANPEEAFLISPKALANEVNLILLDKVMQMNVLSYGDKSVKIGKFDGERVLHIFPR